MLTGSHSGRHKKWATEEGKKSEVKALESLIDEAIAAEFYNIDIDTSTLVDLSHATRDEQQRENYTWTAHFTKYIRARQPKGIEISIGGEIGEVGKYNTTDEVRGTRRREARARWGPGHGQTPETGTSTARAMADGSIARPASTSRAVRPPDLRSEYGIPARCARRLDLRKRSSQFPEATGDPPGHGLPELIIAPKPAAAMKQRSGSLSRQCTRAQDGETDEQFVYRPAESHRPVQNTEWELPRRKTADLDAIRKKSSPDEKTGQRNARPDHELRALTAARYRGHG